jgi:hypothetical protein
MVFRENKEELGKAKIIQSRTRQYKEREKSLEDQHINILDPINEQPGSRAYDEKKK